MFRRRAAARQAGFSVKSGLINPLDAGNPASPRCEQPPTTSRPYRRFFDPTVPILLAALAVHVVRRNLVDIAIFAVAVLVIAIDRFRPLPAIGSATRSVPRPLVAVGCVAFGVLGVFEIGSLPLRIALVTAGLGAAALVLTARYRAADPVGRADRWWMWPTMLVVLALLELTNFVLQPNPQTGSVDHPTISTLIEPLLAAPYARVFGLALWAAAGWWLIAAIRRVGRRR